MGNKSSFELTLSFLLIASLCLQASIIRRYRYYPVGKMNWIEARQYCQRNHIDLITGNKAQGFSLAKELKEFNIEEVWIGLLRDPVNDTAWRWINVKSREGISGNDVSQSSSWAVRQQSKPLSYDCASFNLGTKKWFSRMCSTELHFVCHDDNLVVVNENKTWEDALSHCRSMKTPCVNQRPCKYKHDLLSLELSDYSYVRDRIYRATTDEVWTSLHFLGGKWCWVNGEMLEDQGMLPDCPSQWRHCGTLSKHDTNNWIIRDCSERRNFICYRKLFWIV
ncbi:lymphocyte antigen 75-like [Epinephelus lanceolatus]